MSAKKLDPNRKSTLLTSDIVSFHDNVKKAAKHNFQFRKVLYGGRFMELAVLSIPPGAALGEEKHRKADELLDIVQGKGKVILGGRAQRVHRHDAVFIPAGQLHDLKNTGRRSLKLLSICSPSSQSADVHKSGAKALEEQMRHAWEQ